MSTQSNAPQQLMTPAGVKSHPFGIKQTSRVRPRWTFCLTFLCLGTLAFAIDLPVSRWMVAESWPSPWQRIRPTVHRFLGSIEPFGQPPAVIIVCLALLLCQLDDRKTPWRIAGCALGAGLAADLLKMVLARARPHAFDFHGTVAQTFLGVFPGATGTSHTQSWPSGHTATAVGFGLALSTVFPAARRLFISLAVLVALQRIEAGAHYVSDTLFAAAVACGVWILIFRPQPATATPAPTGS